MAYLNRRRFMGAAEQIDADEPEIIRLLEVELAREMRIEIRWEHIGRPLDGLIGAEGVTILAEIKQPPGPRGGRGGPRSGRRLNENQRDFVTSWPGAKPLVITVVDCKQKVRAEIERQRGKMAGTVD